MLSTIPVQLNLVNSVYLAKDYRAFGKHRLFYLDGHNPNRESSYLYPRRQARPPQRYEGSINWADEHMFIAPQIWR